MRVRNKRSAGIRTRAEKGVGVTERLSKRDSGRDLVGERERERKTERLS